MLTHNRFQQIVTEAVIWRQLSHSNVLPFYGIHQLDSDPQRLCLVSPWMENGTLREFLARVSNTYCVPLVSSKLKSNRGYATNSFYLTQALDVAMGLDYLHDEGIIHGDLNLVRLRLRSL